MRHPIARLRELASNAAAQGKTLDLVQHLEGDPDLRKGLLAWLASDRTVVSGRSREMPDLEGQDLRVLPEDRYEAFDFVGQGAQGVVYRAMDADLQRHVAFKALRPGHALSDEDRPPSSPLRLGRLADEEMEEVYKEAMSRFLQEAWITGGLAHPGIAPLHEIGQTPSGVPYYTMRFIKGETTLRTLLDLAKGKGLEHRVQLLDPFLRVCDTIAYAHSKGVVHRDLKPDNIAIGKYGDVVVLDWGLATLHPDATGSRSRWHDAVETLRRKRERSEPGMVGTPGYMPPEAIGTDATLYRQAGDIYALGTILFELLTGRKPIEYDSIGEYVRRVKESDAPRAREIEPSVPEELSLLCACALDRDPERRHASVSDLTGEVRAWRSRTAVDQEIRALMREYRVALDHASHASEEGLLRQLDLAASPLHQVLRLRPGEPEAEAQMEHVEGRKRETLERQRAETERRTRVEMRASRRHALRRVLTVTSILIAIVTFSTALYTIDRRREAEDAAARALDAEHRARAHLGQAFARLAEEYTSEGRHAAAHLAAAKALATHPTRASWAALAAAGRFSYADFKAVSVSVDIRSLAFDKAQGLLYAGCGDGRVRVWGVDGWKLWAAFTAHKGRPVNSIALSRGGERLFTGAQDYVRVWDARRRKILDTIVGFRGPISRIVIGPEDRILIGLHHGSRPGAGSLEGAPGAVQVWNLLSKRLLWRVDGTRDHMLTGVCLDAKRDTVFVAAENTVTAWSLSKGVPVRALSVESGYVSDLKLAPDGRALFVSTLKLTPGDQAVAGIESWDWRAGRKLAETEAIPGGYNALALSADGRTLAACQLRGHWLQRWRVDGSVLRPLAALEGEEPLLLTDDPMHLFAGHRDASLRVYASAAEDRATPIAELRPGHAAPIRAGVGSVDGHRILTLDTQDRMRVWDTALGGAVGRSTMVPGVTAIAAPTGTSKRYAVARGPLIHWVDVQSGELSPGVAAPTPVRHVVLHPSGDALYAADVAGGVYRLRRDRGALEPLAGARLAQIDALAIAVGDGEGSCLIAAGCTAPPPGGARVLSVWRLSGDAGSAEAPTRILTPHASSIRHLSLDRAGQRAVSGSEDGRIEIWNVIGGRSLETISWDIGTLHALALSRDGTRLFAAGSRVALDTNSAREWRDGSVRVWELVPVVSFESPSRVAARELGYLEADAQQIAALVPAAGDRYLYSVGTQDREILRWNQEGHPAVWRRLAVPEPVLSLTLSSDRTMLFTAHGALRTAGDVCGANQIRAWHVDGDEEGKVIDEDAQGLCCNRIDGRVLAISPSGDALYSGAWSADTESQGDCGPCGGAPPAGSAPAVGQVEMVPPQKVGLRFKDPEAAPKHVAAYRLVKVLPVAHTQEKAPVRFPASYLYIDQPEESVLDLAVSSDGARLYAAGRTGIVYEYDLATMALRRRFGRVGEPASALALTPASAVPDLPRRLITGTRNGEIQFWDLAATEAPVHSIQAHEAGIGALLVSCNGTCLYSAAGTRGIPDEESQMLFQPDTTIKQWDIRTRSQKQEFIGHEDFVTCLALYGRYLYSGSRDGTIRIWDTVTGDGVAIVDCSPNEVLSIAVDGTFLYCGTDREGLLQVKWDYFFQLPDQRIAEIEDKTGLRMHEEELGVTRVLRRDLLESAGVTTAELAR